MQHGADPGADADRVIPAGRDQIVEDSIERRDVGTDRDDPGNGTEWAQRLSARREVVDPRRGFPAELLVAPAEVAVRSRAAVDRPPEVEVPDDGRRTEVEELAHGGRDPGTEVDLLGTERLDQQGHWPGHPDGVGHLHPSHRLAAPDSTTTCLATHLAVDAAERSTLEDPCPKTPATTVCAIPP